MKIDKRKVKWLDKELTVSYETYSNGGGIAIRLLGSDDANVTDPEQMELWTTATANIPGVLLEPNQACIKNYSENEGVLEALIEAGIVAPTGVSCASGFVTLPIVNVTPDV